MPKIIKNGKRYSINKKRYKRKQRRTDERKDETRRIIRLDGNKINWELEECRRNIEKKQTKCGWWIRRRCAIFNWIRKGWKGSIGITKKN